MAKHPLTEAREKQNISQAKLGMKVEISPYELSKIENWRRYPCPSWRDRLSRFFHIPEHELFPPPADLIDMVRQLQEENEGLKLQLKTMQSQGSANLHKTRDNSRYL